MVAATAMVAVDEEPPVGVAPEVKGRLVGYMGEVASGLGRVEQRRAAALYARGLIEAGARKSLEPMVARLGQEADYEALQQFLADSPWDAAVIERAVAERVCPVIEPEAWVLDDTGVVKDGKHSPGVKRQYSGTPGEDRQLSGDGVAARGRGGWHGPVGVQAVSAGGVVRGR